MVERDGTRPVPYPVLSDTRDILRWCRGTAEAMQNFYEGEAVDLLQSTTWHSQSSSFEFDKESMRLNSWLSEWRDDTRPSMRFEPPFEVRVEIQKNDSKPDKFGWALVVGQPLSRSTGSDWEGRYLRYTPQTPSFTYGSCMRMTAIATGPLPSGGRRMNPVSTSEPEEDSNPNPIVRLRMKVWEDRVRAYVNDELVADEPTTLRTAGLVGLTRAIDVSDARLPNHREATQYSFRNFIVERLDEPNPKPSWNFR